MWTNPPSPQTSVVAVSRDIAVNLESFNLELDTQGFKVNSTSLCHNLFNFSFYIGGPSMIGAKVAINHNIIFNDIKVCEEATVHEDELDLYGSIASWVRCVDIDGVQVQVLPRDPPTNTGPVCPR
jgi:hypothetical protein